MSRRPTFLDGSRGVGLLVVATFTAVAVFVGAWFPWREHSYAVDALEHKARNQAALVAYTIAPGIEFGDADMIGEVFQGAARDEDFVGVEAVAADGHTLARLGRVTDRGGVVVRVPIVGPAGRVGTLHLAMSRARVDAESGQQLRIALAIGATIVLLGLFVGVGVTRAIRRISTLTDENVRAGAAAEQERVKARFLANMSHEIRTPLNGVIGLADVLSRRVLDPHASALVASIVRSARNLLGLINDVLDLSRLESGRVEIERAPFDPELSAVTVCETVVSTARQRGLELVLDVAHDVPASVEGDRLRFDQVLTNLVGNAIKFTPKGRVVVSLAWRAAGEGALVARVKDTGVGIPADKLETVFEAFSQADASTTRRFGGTGLGLTISRELVRRMGGELRAESEEGRGSTFSFDVRAPALEPPRAAKLARPPARVLAVVVDAEASALLARHARDVGVDLEPVDVGSLAARLAESSGDAGRAPPVLLWDVAAGRLDGALRDAVAAAVGAGRVHLVLHASAVDERPDEHLASGVLPKPFSRTTFAATLDDVAAPSLRPEGARAPSGLLPRVLVAEDDETNRLVITSFLAELGLAPELVRTGREAVEAATRRGPFALVLMDCQMPEMDGYEASERIRAVETDGGRPPVPIIAVTAHATDADRARAVRAGMSGYVTKPLTLDSFTRAVRELLPEIAGATTGATTTPRGKLAAVFRKSVDDGIATIGAAIERGDLTAVSREAHRLAGSCLAVEEREAAGLAREVETLARAGKADECGEATFALELALAEAAERLSKAAAAPAATTTDSPS